VFGRSAETPFDARALARRAETAWKGRRADESARVSAHVRLAHDRRGRERESPLELHGPPSITITYGHLMPGNEDAAAELLDVYLERANAAARLAQPETAS
jgi:hypothetical protein